MESEIKSRFFFFSFFTYFSVVILLTLQHWQNPEGHFIRELGPLSDRAAETEAILLEHDVPFRPFSESVLSCLPSEGHSWLPKAEELVGRADLRNIDICSIDPPGTSKP
jgi:exosome complex exonuclease DIS3/RRP44